MSSTRGQAAPAGASAPSRAVDSARDSATVGDVAVATTSSTVARSGAWAFFGQVLPQLYTIITSVVAAHYLGVAGLGRLTFIAFVQVTVTLGLTLAFPNTLMRHVGELLGAGKTGAVRPFLAWGLKVQGTAAAIGCVILVGAAAFGASPTSAWIFAAVATTAAILHTVPSAVLIGTQRWRQVTTVGLITGTISMVAKVAALTSGHGLPVLFGIDAVLAFGNLFGTAYLARTTLRPFPRTQAIPAGLRASASRFAAVASISSLLGFIVWQRSEVFFLNHYSTDEQIAFYSIPYSFVAALLFIPTAAASALVPAFATLYGAQAMSRIRSGYSRAVRILVLMVLPITAGSMVLGPAFLQVLYGSSFKHSAPVLLILLASLPAVQLLSVSTALLTGLRRPWPATIVAAVATVVNLGLAFVLIPRYDAVGAAFANTGAQLVGAVAIVFWAARLVGGVDFPRACFARATGASAAAAGVAVPIVLALPALPALVLGFLAFAATFALVSARVRVIPSNDSEWLVSMCGSRMRGLPRRLVLRISAEPRY